ncbi:MAG: cytidine deaminase [Clostridia bacterium]|nr:cytidine deaminase [Clostridia bacterium]
MKKIYDELSLAAKRARDSAYSPYSGYTVGAALLCGSGKIYLGSNVENASFSLTVCAERVAIFKAITEGERDFRAIAIAGAKSGEEVSAPFAPCGSCRQVLAEFSSPDTAILVVTGEGYDLYTLGELLPSGFGKKDLI